MVKNAVNHSRTGHICYHYVRECVHNGQMQVQYCPTVDKMDEILTSP